MKIQIVHNQRPYKLKIVVNYSAWRRQRYVLSPKRQHNFIYVFISHLAIKKMTIHRILMHTKCVFVLVATPYFLDFISSIRMFICFAQAKRIFNMNIYFPIYKSFAFACVCCLFRIFQAFFDMQSLCAFFFWSCCTKFPLAFEANIRTVFRQWHRQYQIHSIMTVSSIIINSSNSSQFECYEKVDLSNAATFN